MRKAQAAGEASLHMSRFTRILPLALACVLFAAQTFPQASASLSTDESGSWWIVKEGFAEMVDRAYSTSATPPLYYLALWGWTRVFGLSEFAMRMLSVCFGAAAVFLLFRLARRWLDFEAAGMAVLVLLYLSPAARAMISIRPYGFGLALLCGAWLGLQRWLEGERKTGPVAAVGCAAGAVWCHYTFALGLLPLLYYSRRLGLGRSFAAVSGVLVLCLPLAGQFLAVAEARGQLSVSANPTLVGLLGKLGPFQLGLFFIAAVCALALLKWRPRWFARFEARSSLVPLVLLTAIPPAAIYVFGFAAQSPMFSARYLLSAAAGVSILAAWLWAGVRPAPPRAALALLLAAAVFAGPARAGRSVTVTDWRALAGWAKQELREQPATALAITSPYAESLYDDHIGRPEREEALLGPMARYLGVGLGELMPWKPNAEAEVRLAKVIGRVEAPCGRLMMVAGSVAGSYDRWLRTQMRRHGFRLIEARSFGSGRGWVYSRCAARPAARATPSPARVL